MYDNSIHENRIFESLNFDSEFKQSELKLSECDSKTYLGIVEYDQILSTDGTFEILSNLHCLDDRLELSKVKD